MKFSIQKVSQMQWRVTWSQAPWPTPGKETLRNGETCQETLGATWALVLANESVHVNNGICHQVQIVSQFAFEESHNLRTGEGAPPAIGFDGGKELEDDVAGFRFDYDIGNVDVDVHDALLVNQQRYLIADSRQLAFFQASRVTFQSDKDHVQFTRI